MDILSHWRLNKPRGRATPFPASPGSLSAQQLSAATAVMGLFNYITAPTSYRNAQKYGSLAHRDQVSFASTAVTLLQKQLPPHSQHPSFGHLTLLVFEAVLEVVCVSLPGYIVARQGLFDAESQKFLANLNVTLFTPCLSTYSDCSGYRSC